MKTLTPEQGMNYLVGQVMKRFKAEGKYADPLLVREILEELTQVDFKKLEQNRQSSPENTT